MLPIPHLTALCKWSLNMHFHQDFLQDMDIFIPILFHQYGSLLQEILKMKDELIPEWLMSHGNVVSPNKHNQVVGYFPQISNFKELA